MEDKKGCCGHPPSCTNAGRCKAYEEFNEQARKSNRAKIQARRERKASRPRQRGDTGRTMDM